MADRPIRPLAYPAVAPQPAPMPVAPAPIPDANKMELSALAPMLNVTQPQPDPQLMLRSAARFEPMNRSTGIRIAAGTADILLKSDA